MIWWKGVLCIGMGVCRFLSISLGDIGDACGNIKSVFRPSASSDDSSKESPEVLKTINKTLSKPKQVAKAIKSIGSALGDLTLDSALILGGSCGDFRAMAFGTFAKFLDCDPDSYKLLN